MPKSLLADPDVVTAAIQILTWAVVTVGAAFISVVIWIWNKTDSKVDRIANSLESLTLTVATEVAAIKATCKANHPTK